MESGPPGSGLESGTSLFPCPNDLAYQQGGPDAIQETQNTPDSIRATGLSPEAQSTLLPPQNEAPPPCYDARLFILSKNFFPIVRVL